MKKIILLIALLSTLYSIPGSAQNASQRIGGATLYWVSDSTWLRLNQQLVMQYGFRSLAGSTMFAPLTMSNSSILLSGASGSILLNGGGNINVTNGGNYLLEGANINTLFGSLAGRNTWIDKNVFSDSAVFSRLFWSGNAVGDTLFTDVVRSRSNFFTNYVDGDNGHDITSTYQQFTSKNYQSFRINGNTKMLIDANGVGADSLHGATMPLRVKAGIIETDTLNAGLLSLEGTPLPLSVIALKNADIIPTDHNTYNLGSAEYLFRDAYFSWAHASDYFLNGTSIEDIFQAKLDTNRFFRADNNSVYVSADYTQNSGQFFSTIEMAVDSADAGNTIYVNNGTYTENVVVSKPLSFNFNDVVINGGSSEAFYISECPDSVSVKGNFTFIGGTYGLRIEQNTYSNTTVNLDFNRGVSPAGTALYVVYGGGVTNSTVNVKYNKLNGYISSYRFSMGGPYSNVVNIESKDSSYSRTNSPGTNAASYLTNGTYNVVENSNIGNGTGVMISSAIVNYKGNDIKNLNDTGHAVNAFLNSKVNITARKISGNAPLYSTLYATQNSRIVVNLIDSLVNMLGNTVTADSTSYIEINGGKVIDSSNTTANTVCYGSGKFTNCTFKNLATSDARVFDFGNSVLPKIELNNCTAEGNSSYGIAAFIANPNIVIRNTIFYNGNLSGYCLRNYGTTNIPVAAYNSYTNVTHYNLGAGTFSFSFPNDSVRVASIEKVYVSRTGLTAQLDTLPQYNKPLNIFTYNVNIGGFLNVDTLKNAAGPMYVDDTLTVTKRINVTQDLFASNDVFSGMNRYHWARANASGTLGAGFYSPSDGLAVFKNAGVSSDATIQALTMILTGLPVYADNAAALAGGLTANKLYRTSTGQVMIVY
jgi:hypothetical protein